MTDTSTASAAQSDTGGGTLLTTGIPAAPPPRVPDGADKAVQGVQDGPPEWAPAKYWDPQTKSVKTEELGKGYKNLEQLLGKDRIPVPQADDDEDGWQRWYAASGRPEKPDDYEFERPSLPSDLPYDEDTEKAFRTWAHVNGLNKKQAKNLYDGYVKTQTERHSAWATAQKQARAQSEMALRREHGNQYEQKVAQAKAALSQYADPEYIKWLEESGQGNDPRVIRAWIKVGQEMSGETKLKGAVQPTAQPADLDKAIADFRGQHEKALFSKDHPDHERRVKEYNKLFEMRFGQ